MPQATSNPRVGRVPRTEEQALRSGEEMRTVHRETEEGRNTGEWLEGLEGQYASTFSTPYCIVALSNSY